jgi:hypothetical protein
MIMWAAVIVVTPDQVEGFALGIPLRDCCILPGGERPSLRWENFFERLCAGRFGGGVSY